MQMMMVREKENELVELFQVAKKAAEAAETLEGGEVDESRCLDALSHLKAFPVTTQDLLATQVGKHIRALMKHDNKRIQDLAADIFTKWKGMVLDHGICDENTRSFETKNSIKRKTADAEPHEVDNIKVNKQTVASTPAALPRLSSLPKCNDPLRDKVREQINEALCKVASECKEEIKPQVNSCDTFRVAVSVESALLDKWGRSNGPCKIKYRSLLFNLKDKNNPDFRRRVLLGHVEPENIADLTAEEMASDARQLENELIKKKALYNSELGAAPAATTDQFKCGRCGRRKTTYHQMQTRSADEPMTTYLTCIGCNHHWKFD